MLVNLLFGESSLHGLPSALSSHDGERGRGREAPLLGVFSYEDTNAFGLGP